MNKKNCKKADQLGMPIGTASNRLRKQIIFALISKLNENFCFQCGEEIKTVDELSIEHKIPYLDSDDPVKLFFDLDNIAYSHLSCNCGASRYTPKENTCPSLQAYHKGCRCYQCVTISYTANLKGSITGIAKKFVRG